MVYWIIKPHGTQLSFRLHGLERKMEEEHLNIENFDYNANEIMLQKEEAEIINDENEDRWVKRQGFATYKND